MGAPIPNGTSLEYLEYSRQHFYRHVSRETSLLPDRVGCRSLRQRFLVSMFHVKHDEFSTTRRQLRAHRKSLGGAEDTLSGFPGSSRDTLIWHPQWA